MMKSSLLLPALGAATIFAAPAGPVPPPPTLLQIAGVTPTPARLAHSVVLIIDVQRDYVAGPLRLDRIEAALGETQRLLARARATGTPVIHIQQLNPPNRQVFVAGTPGAEFAAEATPVASELVITKRLPDSFAGTPLAGALRTLGRHELIVAGCMTHLCVSTTVRSALGHGYAVTVVADACATRDLPDGAGGTIAAGTVHRVALAELADRFATVVSTVDAIPD